jgi:hypothetical protein
MCAFSVRYVCVMYVNKYIKIILILYSNSLLVEGFSGKFLMGLLGWEVRIL